MNNDSPISRLTRNDSAGQMYATQFAKAKSDSSRSLDGRTGRRDITVPVGDSLEEALGALHAKVQDCIGHKVLKKGIKFYFGSKLVGPRQIGLVTNGRNGQQTLALQGRYIKNSLVPFQGSTWNVLRSEAKNVQHGAVTVLRPNENEGYVVKYADGTFATVDSGTAIYSVGDAVLVGATPYQRRGTQGTASSACMQAAGHRRQDLTVGANQQNAGAYYELLPDFYAALWSANMPVTTTAQGDAFYARPGTHVEVINSQQQLEACTLSSISLLEGSTDLACTYSAVVTNPEQFVKVTGSLQALVEKHLQQQFSAHLSDLSVADFALAMQAPAAGTVGAWKSKFDLVEAAAVFACRQEAGISLTQLRVQPLGEDIERATREIRAARLQNASLQVQRPALLEHTELAAALERQNLKTQESVMDARCGLAKAEANLSSEVAKINAESQRNTRMNLAGTPEDKREDIKAEASLEAAKSGMAFFGARGGLRSEILADLLRNSDASESRFA
jgi:hypothetical protein